MSNAKQNAEATIKELAAAFPAAFTLDPTQVRPLKLGIRQDLFAQSQISHRRITAALQLYCNSVAYRAAHTEGAERVNLTGIPVGTVTAAEAESANTASPASKRAGKPAAGPTKQAEASKQDEETSAARVRKQKTTMRTSKTTATPATATTGPRRLGLADLRKAAAARKAGR